jgi:hypothetical protein
VACLLSSRCSESFVFPSDFNSFEVKSQKVYFLWCYKSEAWAVAMRIGFGVTRARRGL